MKYETALKFLDDIVKENLKHECWGDANDDWDFYHSIRQKIDEHLGGGIYTREGIHYLTGMPDFKREP